MFDNIYYNINVIIYILFSWKEFREKERKKKNLGFVCNIKKILIYLCIVNK